MSSAVLSERAVRHFWRGAGALSLKSFRGGRALYDTGRGRFAVDDHSYLILNHGREYEIEIDCPEPLESLCVFFEPGMIEDVLRAATAAESDLLDEPSAPTSPVVFVERTYRHDALVDPALGAIRTALAAGVADAGHLGELVHGLAGAMLRTHAGAIAESRLVPASRPAVREELYRRLHLARDYAEACYAEPLAVVDLARVACLSPAHFLRSFRALFGVTPHRYLTEVRLAHARRLLETTAMPVTTICFAVGFESLGSFSSLMRRSFGAAPATLRRNSSFREAGRGGEA